MLNGIFNQVILLEILLTTTTHLSDLTVWVGVIVDLAIDGSKMV